MTLAETKAADHSILQCSLNTKGSKEIQSSGHITMRWTKLAVTSLCAHSSIKQWFGGQTIASGTSLGLIAPFSLPRQHRPTMALIRKFFWFLGWGQKSAAISELFSLDNNMVKLTPFSFFLSFCFLPNNISFWLFHFNSFFHSNSFFSVYQ